VPTQCVCVCVRVCVCVCVHFFAKPGFPHKGFTKVSDRVWYEYLVMSNTAGHLFVQHMYIGF